MAQARVLFDDCFYAMKDMEDQSVDAIITDPPYFLDRMGDDWQKNKLSYLTQKSRVSSLPGGMKFDPKQGQEFQKFMHQVAVEGMRILKPGGFFLAMSAPRLYHRLGVAVEDAGFEVRDMWAWIYTQNQVKAMSVERFLAKEELNPDEEAILREELKSWKTPQVKSLVEPIVFAQKPKNGKTFLKNWLEHKVGLVDIYTGVGEEQDMTTANVLTTGPISAAYNRAYMVSKPGKAERGTTDHVSVKPLALMEQLIRATVPEGGLVLDPFNGSGSTGIAALALGRNYVGIEKMPEYYKQSFERFASSSDLIEEGSDFFRFENAAKA